MANYNIEEANERFEEEVKVLLSGYLGSDSDTIDYLALKIARLHDLYLKEAIGE